MFPRLFFSEANVVYLHLKHFAGLCARGGLAGVEEGGVEEGGRQHQEEARPREHKVSSLGQFLWDLVEKAKTIKDNNIRRKIDLAKTR